MSRVALGGAVALHLTIWALTFGAGCGGPPGWAQKAVTSTAIGIEDTSNIVAPMLEADARAVADALREELPELAGEEFMTEWRSRTDRWRKVRDALVGAGVWLQLAQTAIDAWRRGGEEDFNALVPCLGQVLLELVSALEAVRVPIPDGVQDAVEILEPFLSDRCEVTP